MTERVFLRGRGFWMPGVPDLDARRAGRVDPSIVQPRCEIVPSRTGRGTSLMTRASVEVATQALRESGVEPAHVAIVFGSHHGEVQIAVDQMQMMREHDGLLSPARFKNSVHNTGAGLFSLATDNRGFATAIAAGFDTVAMTLLEASLLLAVGEAEAAVVALAEEPVPAPFDSFAPHGALGVGLVIARDPGPRPLASLTLPFRDPDLGFAPDPAGDGNVVTAACGLLDAVEARRGGRLPLSLAGGEPWCLDLDFPS